MLTTAGKIVRALSFKTDLPYIEVQDVGGSAILTDRIAVSGLKVVVVDGNPMQYTITILGSDCTALPKVAHQIQFFAASSGGSALATAVADVDKTLSSAADQVIETYTLTIS